MNQSNMVHQFGQVPTTKIQRSSFQRNCAWKGTIDAGYLYPIYCDEVLPADTFNVKCSLFGRMNTPLRPIMDNLYLDTHWFFVPNRLIWENWVKFCGERDNPADSIDFTVPQLAPTSTSAGYVENQLLDYMGVPPKINISGLNDVTLGYVNALHTRAYNLIWNEFFRSQDLQDSVTVDVDNGPDAEADYVLLKRGKRRDYFTSCLPNPQKGTEVLLPLGTKADIAHDITGVKSVGVYSTVAGADRALDASGALLQTSASLPTGSKLYADLTNATAASINDIREAFQLQKFLERDQRSGSRYIEIILAHFRTVNPDYRLQRPEFLGATSSMINISPVANTSEDATNKQGDLTGIGTVSHNGHAFIKSFTEHGVILGLASVRSDLTYQQGLDRMWRRRDRYDYYWPVLQGLGEQAVLNKEIYYDGNAAMENVFGYQERFAEYKYKNSLITSKFRSSYATSLDDWHIAQEFAVRPALGSTFIQEDPPIDRVVAVTSEPDFILDCFFQVNCVRPMPIYNVPGMVDHF